MPIYEYQCQSCHHVLEALQGFSEAPLTDCPACKGKTLQRLVSAAGFQLKGTGWYATDFKGAGKQKPATDTTKETPAEGGGDKPASGDSGSGKTTGTES